MRIGNWENKALNYSAIQGKRSGGEDKVSAGIQKQISNVQEKLRGLNEKEGMSVEEKIRQKEELRQQIQDLNKQLAQRKLEKSQEEQRKKAKEAKKQLEKNRPEETNKQGIKSVAMEQIITADSTLKQADAAYGVKVSLEGTKGVLEAEIKLDKASGASVNAKEAALAETEGKINQLTARMMSETSQVNETLSKTDNAAVTEEKQEKEEAVADENKKAEKSTEVKIPASAQTYVPIDLKL